MRKISTTAKQKITAMPQRHIPLPLILLLLLSTCLKASNSSHICNSIEIRTVKDFKLLQNCTIVVGHVRIVNLPLAAANANVNDSNSNSSSADMQLSTAVEEITDYLLVYRSHGLSTLRVVFPRLRLIRGRELLFDRYALVVYENRNLLNLGLVALLRIQAGAIRVEANPQLCYVDTVNWVLLLGNRTQQHFSLKRNKTPNHCPLCIAAAASNATSTNRVEIPEKTQIVHGHCWDMEVMQLTVSTADLDSCPEKCAQRGCDAKGRCCSAGCLSDCVSSTCSLCGNFMQEQKCVDNCVLHFEYQKRECITSTQCSALRLIPHAGICALQCPDNFHSTHDLNGHWACSLNCSGQYVVQSTKDLNSLRDCEVIQGSLTIELHDIKSKISDLEQALSQVKEITGFLKVVRCPQILSLSFLQSLHTIRGDQLIDNKYALYVVDNHHLEHIWDSNQDVIINRGHLYFHLNPRLCYEKILALQSSLKSVQEISVFDASPNSNGERVVCDVLRSLNVTVEDFNSTAVRMKLAPLSAEDKQALIGYIYHYKESPVQNASVYDGRHGCGHDNWHLAVSPTSNVRFVITHLKPYTQYAYFVKTLTMVDYHIRLEAYSKIQYFRTMPSKPGPVAKIYTRAVSSREMVVHWWPPRNPNGVIEKYIIQHEAVDDPKTDLRARPIASNCQCKAPNPEESGPLPEDEEYYNKEQVIYDEALPNLIYVPRSYTENQPRVESTTPTANDTQLESGSLTTNISEPLPSSNNTQKDKKKHSKKQRSDKQNFLHENFFQKLEKQALAEQDTGIADFPILKPRPLCKTSKASASVQYQLEHDCAAQESYSGLVQPGNVHLINLKGLQAETTYRISVRACVKDVVNGCGVEAFIYANTVSKTMEKFMKDFNVQL